MVYGRRIALRNRGVISRHQFSPAMRFRAAIIRRGSPRIGTMFSPAVWSIRASSTNSKYLIANFRPTRSVSKATNACSRADMISNVGVASGYSTHTSVITSVIPRAPHSIPWRNFGRQRRNVATKIRADDENLNLYGCGIVHALPSAKFAVLPPCPRMRDREGPAGAVTRHAGLKLSSQVVIANGGLPQCRSIIHVSDLPDFRYAAVSRFQGPFASLSPSHLIHSVAANRCSSNGHIND